MKKVRIKNVQIKKLSNKTTLKNLWGLYHGKKLSTRLLVLHAEIATRPFILVQQGLEDF